MDRQTVVRDKRTHRTGVVVDNPWSLGDPPDTVYVVWGGQTTFRGMKPERLEVIGPENAVADMVKCGGGRGADACIFLTYGKDGWGCHRFGGLRYQLIFNKPNMGAQREPTEMFPDCYLPEA